MRPEYYDHHAGLESALRECNVHGDEICIGFVGGAAALRSAGLTTLEGRRYWKVRYPDRNDGHVVRRNWIKGSEFLVLVRDLRSWPPIR